MPDTHLLMTADAAGGVWTYALEMAQALSARGIATTLAVLGEAPSAPAQRQARAIAGLRLELTGLPLDWTATTASEVAQAGEEIARLAGRVGADIVQLNAPALAATASFPVPIIGALHSCVATWWEAVRGDNDLPADLDWRAKLTRTGLNRVDAAIAPSQALARQAQRVYALPRMPIVIRNGRSAHEAAATWARDIVVLTAGRLWDEGKNIAALDRAAGGLPFKVCAVGPVRGPNGATAHLRNLDWLGVLESEALRDAMARSAVFVSPALYEPFGLAVLEAAQAGRALVLADIPTFRELWDGAALFVDPRDPQALADALDKVTADAALCTRLGAAARHRALNYTLDKSADALAGLMRSLVAEPQRRAS
ncbi:MAG: glycosyltransferase family 4 protein [Methylobacteriaceae bacterium]|nr:glycosyltransferase family 4 protein [Methylobacteriaceae bacterium]